MSDKTQVLLGEREGQRLERLRRAESEIQQSDDGILATFVLRECVRLWIDAISDLGLFAIAPGVEPMRSEITESQTQAPITRLDQAKVDGIIVGLGSVDLDDPVAMHELAQESLALLDAQLSSLTEPTNSGAGIHPRFFSESEDAWIDGRAMITAWRGRSQLLQESLRVLRLLDGLQGRTQPVLDSTAAAVEEARGAGQELERLRAELDHARAEKAQGTLSAQFKSLRTREHATSWLFRFATLGLAGVAIAVAVAVPTGAKWPEVAVHLTIVAILGGASAYTARLASSHRAMGDWADSVHVQLNTFQDFLGVIDSDDARTRVYEEFGRRVLGSPPAVNGESTESGAMPTAQLVRLANEIASARK
ncbi:hypothetical protein [Microbacterium sp.]|uniref:hypothetical protein n=1 Tax=Microbacterium sp. TaxID=51671 RepID=UPI00273414BA|nr:hypothetical protein [Microbacterium sp.]MDP3951456.1 hypothetical protein [Microbacterium sp.]